MTDEKKDEKKKEEQPRTEATDAAQKPAAEIDGGAAKSAPTTLRAVLGEKVAMTQYFTEQGAVRACTIVKTGPCSVVRVKSREGRDGYNAVLLGYGERREKGLAKPVIGQFKVAGVKPVRWQKEVRMPDVKGFAAGQVVDLAGRFSAGDYVDVQGTSKGKGFAGVMKRHGFKGMPASHGASDKERAPGSIASRRSLGRVLPGQRMAGHMGARIVSAMKIEVVHVEPEKNLIYLKGSVPGPNGSFVLIHETTKKLKKRPERRKKQRAKNKEKTEGKKDAKPAKDAKK